MKVHKKYIMFGDGEILVLLVKFKSLRPLMYVSGLTIHIKERNSVLFSVYLKYWKRESVFNCN